ncbi:hypothetical protein NKG05_13025 [Oerskovia sp. M15]
MGALVNSTANIGIGGERRSAVRCWPRTGSGGCRSWEPLWCWSA